MTDLIERARLYATAAHTAVGQLRKYTNEPYIVHPTEVAEIIHTVAHTPAMVAAAYLHDTIEDTEVTKDDICREFGAEVAVMVAWLTDASTPDDGNRAARKAIDRDHIRAAPGTAQTVKVADIISNVTSIVAHDPEFAEVYLQEKSEMLDVLVDADRGLWQRAVDLIQSSRIALERAKLDSALRRMGGDTE